MANKLFEPNSRITVYTDGGARGNPGPAAIGVIIGGKRYAEKIGHTTNNIAEYKAIIFALQKLKLLVSKKETKSVQVEIRADSELAIKQLNGQFKIKDADLQPLFLEIWNLKVEFKKVDFVQIPREQNKDADRLVNEALDSN